jgi:hypothetical protein
MNMKNIKNRFEKVVTATTDGINKSLEDDDVGNYWFNKNWKLFCEDPTGYHEHYFVLRLEQYDGNGKCINPEFDTETTKDDTVVEMRATIGRLIRRNMFLLDICNN